MAPGAWKCTRPPEWAASLGASPAQAPLSWEAACDLPAITIVCNTDAAAALEHAQRLVRAADEAVDGGGERQWGGFCRTAEVQVLVPYEGDADADAGGCRDTRVPVLHLYTRGGSLRLDVPPRDQRLQQAAMYEALKQAASVPRVDRQRRVVVVHGACALARDLQHALRWTMERESAENLFVLTAARAGALDAALLSRTLVLRFGIAPDPDSSATPAPAAEAAAELWRSPRATPGSSSRAVLRAAQRAQRALQAALTEGPLPRALLDATLGAAAAGGAAADPAALAAAAADADHMAAVLRGKHPKAAELAARSFVERMQAHRR